RDPGAPQLQRALRIGGRPSAPRPARRRKGGPRDLGGSPGGDGGAAMSLFGTDGVRGPAGVPPIDERTAAAVGRAAARWARAAGGRSVVIGRDTRPSGAALEGAVAAGVASEGLR